MILTAKTRYGVMAMVDLASQQKQIPITLKEISERQKITIKYLEQIFSKLRRNNLVIAIKGPGGGYYLNKSSDKIYILDIIKALEEPIKMTRCREKNIGCIYDNVRCITHDLWEGLSEQIYNYLNSVNLSDICEKKLSKKLDFGINEKLIRAK